MGFSKYIYDKALEQKRKDLQAGDTKRAALKEKIYADFPRIKEIENELQKLGMQVVMQSFSGNKEEIFKIQEKTEALMQEKAKLSVGVNLEIPFVCEKCKDTGVLNGKYCECVELLAKKIQTEELSSAAPFSDCRFDNFNLDYYPSEGEAKIAPKLRMEKNFNYIKKFASEFPKSENLLFIGGTGLGKTHLSIAIGNEVLKKGYSVYYSSADEFISNLERERYNRSNLKIDVYETSNDCDLLIIDDLGTEFLTSFGKSAIYNVINSRILKGKSTIVNTNLTMAEIAEKYTPRVSSRFIGNYTSLLFDGKDIRQIKAQNK